MKKADTKLQRAVRAFLRRRGYGDVVEWRGVSTSTEGNSRGAIEGYCMELTIGIRVKSRKQA